MERRDQTYSRQQSKFAFQPQSTYQLSLDQVNPGRTSIHSSFTSSNAGGNRIQVMWDAATSWASKQVRQPHAVRTEDTLIETPRSSSSKGGPVDWKQANLNGAIGETQQKRFHAADQTALLESNGKSPASLKQPKPFSANQPLVGIIDQGFGEGEHGTEVLETISGINDQAPTWLGRGVGSGGWAELMTEFVGTAKASGHKQAVANLSFDLTEKRPDGSVTTRSQLTAEEQKALAYARDNGVLIVASAGNTGGRMSALGQASQQFDNIVAVGAAEGKKRANYSNHGNGLDLLAPGSQRGDELALLQKSDETQNFPT